MSLRTLATLSGAIALIVGVGGPATAAPVRAPHTVTVTSESSNQTVRLHVGDKLKVHLGTAYRRPHSSRPKVLQRLGYSGGYPTQTDARATFTAIKHGHADVTSMTDAQCLHTTPMCEIAQQNWVVHVIVSD